MERISGIYLIRNTVTYQCYVGSSVNIYKRWAAHKDQLRRKVHHTPYFERSWHKYGECNFCFQVMEEVCPEKHLLEYVEQSYIDLFRPSFNVSTKAGRVELTESQRAAISLRMRGKGHPNWGKKRPSHSKAMSGDNNYFFGKSHTEEYKINSSLNKTKLSPENVVDAISLLKSGIPQTEIAKRFNVSHSVINRLTSGKIKAYKDIDVSGIDRKKIGNMAYTGRKNWMSQLVLDTQMGIYYESINEAAYAKGVNAGTLSSYFQGKAKNKTGLIKV